MGINLNLDYTTLFSSLGGSNASSVAGSTILADYSSIKNGSYLKLMKAYYAKTGVQSSSASSSVSSSAGEETKNLAKVESSTDELKDSAAALITKGSKSLFNKKEITTKNEDGTTTTKTDYDRDAIYKGVKAFIDDYNAVVKNGGISDSKNVLRQTLNMTKAAKSYSSMLSDVGITIGSNNQLSINEEDFKKANMTTVKSLFNGNSSFAYNIDAKASMINYTAESEAKKAGTYTAAGIYGNSYKSGSIYNGYF